MRGKLTRLLSLLAVCLPIAAMADITSISPQALYVGDTETFIIISGSSLTGSVSTQVTFSGPAGTFSIEPNLASPISIEVFVPIQVTLIAGQYSVQVLANDGSSVRVTPAAFLSVIERIQSGNPVINLPENIIAEATGPAGAAVFFTPSVLNYGTGLVTSCNHVSGSIFPLGTTLLTCTATDSFGQDTAVTRVFVTDTQAPVLTSPADIFTTNPVVTFSVTATDNVDGTLIPICAPASGSTFSPGRTIVNCVATDAHLNSGRASFKVVLNGEPPVLILSPDLIVEATGLAGASVTYAATAVHGETVTCDRASGSTFPFGLTFVACSASNAFGTETGKFSVTVRDTTPPLLILPADITVISSNSSGVSVAYVATATDIVNGAVAVSCSPLSGSTFSVGETTVKCTAHDQNFNFSFGSFKVTVQDQPPPTLTLPADISAEATGAGGAIVIYSASASGGASISCNPSSGSLFAIATATVQCSASNASGTTTGSFKITVRDTTPPLLTLPSAITSEATSAAGAVVSYLASATDLVDGNVAVQCLPASGSTFALGSIIVKCSAIDLHANKAQGTFTIVVRDTTPPTLSLPADITAEATGPDGATVSYAVSAVDLVDGNVTPVCTPASGSRFALGSTLVQCTATDVHGNQKAGSFHVLVRDTTAPTIVRLEASPTAIWPADHKMIPVTINVIATDLVDPHPVSTIISVTSNQPTNSTGDGNTSSDWTITGPLTLVLRAERAGSIDRIYTITVQATDASGNSMRRPLEVRVAQTSRGRASR